MNQTPDLTVIHGGKPEDPPAVEAAAPLIELAPPKSASEAFMFLAVRAAEQFAQDPKRQEWALISEVLKKIAEFASAFPYASARHVKWAYLTICKRVPQARDESEPLVKWLGKVPALATDKAAAAPLLWHYIASCAGQYAASIPRPQGQPGAWQYQRGELMIPCSNEEAYSLGKQRHYWSTFQGRLLYVVGVLLQEMAGVPVPQAAVVPAGEVGRATLQAVPAGEAAVQETDRCEQTAPAPAELPAPSDPSETKFDATSEPAQGADAAPPSLASPPLSDL